MDFSKKYIKMCDTEEIQLKWNPKLGDVFFNEFSGHTLILTENLYREHLENEKIDLVKCKGYIWLPRQDQLQEMLIEHYKKENIFDGAVVNTLMVGLIWFWRDKSDEVYGPYEILRFTSMEQLWLVFVMYELYKKAWDEVNNVWILVNWE